MGTVPQTYLRAHEPAEDRGYRPPKRGRAAATETTMGGKYGWRA